MEESFKNMHLQLSAEDIRKIDGWKVSHGMKSRTEAIRAMIRIVTSNNSDEVSNNSGSFSEGEKYGFMKPENINSNKQQSDETLEEIIRKVVKEELLKTKY